MAAFLAATWRCYSIRASLVSVNRCHLEGTPARMKTSLSERMMGQGLRLLRRVSGSSVLDDEGRRNAASKLIYGASRGGFSALLQAGKPVLAAQKLSRRLRPKHNKPADLFDLTPSDEQQMMVEAMQRFAEVALRPAAAKEEHCDLPALLEQGQQLGLTSIALPEAIGGAADTAAGVTQLLIAEALAHGDMGLAAALLSGPSVANLILAAGSREQQAGYLPLFSGEAPVHAALAALEAATLFDPARLQTRASKTHSGYTLNGEKQMVIAAQLASLLLVSASLEDGRRGWFLVPGDQAGLKISEQPAMGLRSAQLCKVELREVQLSADALLGEGESAEALDRSCAVHGQIAAAALTTGTAQAVLDYVSPYVNERKAFGEPISHRQSVAFMVADIAIELEGMRLANWRAAARADRGLQAHSHAAWAYDLALRHGRMIGAHGVQLLGGHGFVKEHPVERWYRDLAALPMLQHHLYL